MTSDRSIPGYKKNAIGLIPEDWENLLLGDVITFQRGFDLPNRLRKPGDVPIVSSSGITDTHSHAPVSSPGVVTGRYGTIGEVFFIEQDFWPLNTTLFVSDFKDNDPLFIYFLLKTIDYKTYSGKSGVPGVNRNDLHEISVKLPSLAEQRSLAQALSDVDALIAALEQLIAKQRHLKTATMQQLLTGKTRLPGFGEGKGYQQTEVGVIPEDWNVLKIADIVKNERISSGIYKEKSLYGKGSRIIKLGDVFSLDYFDSAKAQRVVLNTDELLTYRVDVGDIFIALASVKLEGVGKVMLVTHLDEDTAYDHNVAMIRANELVNPRFLFYLLKSNLVRREISKLATQVGTTFLKASTILAFQLPIPSVKTEQASIATVLSDMDTEIAALETRLAKTQSLKQGMMQELLTGRTRLL
jgi:type I restriction enzyme, S subunit